MEIDEGDSSNTNKNKRNLDYNWVYSSHYHPTEQTLAPGEPSGFIRRYIGGKYIFEIGIDDGDRGYMGETRDGRRPSKALLYDPFNKNYIEYSYEKANISDKKPRK